MTRLYIAGTASYQRLYHELKKSPYILESFYYVSDWQIDAFIKGHEDTFLLDSGAFTFMAQHKKNKKMQGGLKEYTEKYIDFVKKNNVKNYFELDLDDIIGVKETLKLRNYIESKVGRKCIPVFHKARGLEEFKKLCKEYDYIALGGMVDFRNNPKVLNYFLRYANKHNTKVHLLGFTPSLNVVKKLYPFYSCDSTSWNLQRFGGILTFDPLNFKKKIVYKQDKRLKSITESSTHNLREFLKIQKLYKEL